MSFPEESPINAGPTSRRNFLKCSAGGVLSAGWLSSGVSLAGGTAESAAKLKPIRLGGPVFNPPEDPEAGKKGARHQIWEKQAEQESSPTAIANLPASLGQCNLVSPPASSDNPPK